jgi:hypothetical protein
VTLRDLTLADALAVCGDMRPEDAACVRAMTGQEPGEWYAVDRWRTSGPGWGLEQNGQPWAIGGLSMPLPWLGLLWMVARPGLTGESWRKVLRATRKVLAVASDSKGPQYVHRIEVHVLSGWVGAERFAKRLGLLSLESVRRGCGANGEDVQVWAWVGPAKGA